jgi:hypothetical protein
MPRARQAAERRGRRVLLWTAALFLLIQLAAGIVLDYLPAVRFPNFDRAVARAAARPGRPTVVCLGSSRFGTLLFGGRMTAALRRHTGDGEARVLNLAVPGGDLLVSERLLAEALAAGAAPRVAVIEVCPEVVNRHNEWLGLHALRHLRWDDMPTHLPEVTRSGNLGRLLRARLVPLFMHRVYFQERIGELVAGAPEDRGRRPEDICDAQMVTPVSDAAGNPSEDDRNRELIASLRPASGDAAAATQAGLRDVRRCLRRYRPGGLSAAALARMLRLCREHGVEPILVGVPVAQAHRQLYEGKVEARFLDYMRRVEREFGCRFVDWRGELPDGLFVDNHHATVEGAKLFSRRLTWEVIAPPWQRCREAEARGVTASAAPSGE